MPGCERVTTETAEAAMVAAEAVMVAAAATTMTKMANGVTIKTAAAATGRGSAAEMRRRCVAVLAVGRCGSEGRAWREGGGEGTARAARGGQRRRRGRRGEVRGGGGGGDDDDDDDHGAGVGHGVRTCLICARRKHRVRL